MARAELAGGDGRDHDEEADLSFEASDAQPPSDQRFVLSYMQEQLWFLARLNPDLPIDNLPWLIDTPPSLDVPVLTRSLQDLVARHEALRTTFIDEEGRPLQKVHPSFELDLLEVSLEELPAVEQEPEMWRVIEAELRRPFDFELRPPVRAILVRRSGGLNKLALIVNHIAIDTFSAYNILFPQLISLYNAYSSGEQPSLPPANLQIRHYAQWQRRRAQSDDLAEHIRYWKRQLENLPSAFSLPADRPRPLSPTASGDERSHLLPDNLIKVARLLAREEQATLFTVLLAAFFVLLHRYTEQEDIFIGTAVADRASEQKRSIFGPLINMVVLRADIQGDLTFREVIRRARDVLSAAREHSEPGPEPAVPGRVQSPALCVLSGLGDHAPRRHVGHDRSRFDLRPSERR
jgi:hypothetical protein